MTFGEKLLALRRAKGWSQEALAERLQTTRQAVSKWENDQGYPETDKLLAISDLFAVSLDALLKDDPAQHDAPRPEGYYVSRECAAGYLAHETRLARWVAAGIALLIGTGVPCFLMEPRTLGAQAFAAVVIFLGILALLPAVLADDPYPALARQRLLLDAAVRQELRARRDRRKRRLFLLLALGCTCIILAVLAGRVLTERGAWISPASEGICLLTGLGMYCLTLAAGLDEPYGVLLESETRRGRLYVRLMRGLQRRIAVWADEKSKK